MSYKPTFLYLIKECFNVIYSIIFAPYVKFTKQSVVIIMDPIEAYSNLYSTKHIRNINKLITYATKNDVPVIFTRWIRTKEPIVGDKIDEKGHWTFYVPNNETNIVKEIHQNGTIIEVKHTNAFMHEDFKELVKNKDNIILAGAWLESCILNTTRCALDCNMSVSVVRNASTGHFPLNYISMFDIQSVYGTIVLI
tara:strand:+ start:63 stop:647 length:585 start_codon:yes stop_codon:yes gene_type:complete